MTTEEKLNHFFEHSMESAHREAEAMICEHKEALEKLFSEHKAMKKRQSEVEVAAETEKLRRELNKTISAEQLHIKRTLSKKNMEIKDKLFEEVGRKLNAYKKDPEYPQYLCRKIREALDFANGDEMIIYIDPSDEALIPVLQDETGFMPTVSRESFNGGIRAVISAKNILIDSSFTALLNDAKESFTFDGGLRHE